MLRINEPLKLIYFTLHIILFIFFNYSILYAERCQKHETGYIIASDTNGIFSQDTLHEIADCARIVILNTPLIGTEQYCGLKKIISELHHRNSDLKILLYSWVTVWYERGQPRVGWYIMSDIEEKKIWHLEKRKDKNGQSVIFPDIRINEYQEWIEKKISDTVKMTDADGIFIDFGFRSPTIQIKRCQHNPSMCNGYQNAFDDLIKKLKKKLQGKLILFNGIFSDPNIPLKDQLKTLQQTDGTIIEYFGMKPNNGESNFAQDIEFYLHVTVRHPSKKIILFGRSPWNQKTKHSNWEKYLYAAYQLIAGDNTLFKFNSSFQAPEHAGDSGGLYISPLLRLTLGKPLGHYIQRGGLFERYFTKGYVALCRHDYTSNVTIQIEQRLYNDKGEPVSGLMELQPGDAVVLFKQKTLSAK